MSTVPGASIAVPNRWLIALAACVLQLALGALYAWSVFLAPVEHLYGVSALAANGTYILSVVSLGVITSVGGLLQQRAGPRLIASIGGLLYGLGLLLAGVTAPLHSLWLLYFSYGILGGCGAGLAYIVPLAMLIGWFPDRRGFITGLAVAGFGLGAFVLGPVAALLVQQVGLATTFIILGSVYLCVTVLAAQTFRASPAGYAPAGWTPSPRTQRTRTAGEATLPQAVRSPVWWLLWCMILVNTLAGASLISVASPLAQAQTHVNALTASLLVSTVSVFNGLGRLLWGWFSDTIGRLTTFVILYVLQIVAFLVFPHILVFALLLLPAAVVASCYGGGFGTMPALTADIFGVRHAGAIYGVILLAWSLGSIIGPLLIVSLSTEVACTLIACVLAAGLLLVAGAWYLLRQRTGVQLG